MRIQPFLIVAVLSAALLAGCTESGGDPATQADPDDRPELESGKGAIAGLLVDDRFRPIHLVESPTGEFQTTGFVLLQETGQQAQSNENGEFAFVNIEPGQYTLRVTAAGHEATPQRVTVTEDVYNEASVIARRVASDEGFILVQEYAIFAACGVDALVIGTIGSTCTPDNSGDSNRFSFGTDYRDYNDTVSFLVTEVKVNQRGDYTVVIRQPGDTAFGGAYYTEAAIRDSDYIKVFNEYGEINTEHDQRGNVPWMNDSPMDNILFYDGMFKEDLYGAYDGEATCTQDPGVPQGGLVQDRSCRGFSGVGARLGIQATFVQSLFLGTPDVDLDSYCVLC